MSKQLRWYNPACFRVLPSRFTFRFLLWWNAAVVLCKMTPRFTFRLVIVSRSVLSSSTSHARSYGCRRVHAISRAAFVLGADG